MSDPFDYFAPAELYPASGKGFRRKLVSYKRFVSAAAALKYAMEELSPESLAGAILEINEDRFDKDGMRALYASSAYPLPRARSLKDTAALPSQGESDSPD